MASTPPPEAAALFLGEVIEGRYEIVSFIAPGGFGYVFEARDRQLDRHVAVKVLQLGAASPAAIEFDSECEVLVVLEKASSIVDSYGNGEHPLAIVTPGGAVATVPVRFVVLELADACLSELVVNRRTLDWEDRLRLFRGVVRGVHQMHLQRIVHRDLKSENVLVFPDGASAMAKIADFGRSRILTRPARFGATDYLYGRGDLRFAPPEALWLQGVDSPRFWRRVDLYHLGSVLFEFATGQGVTSIALGNPMLILQRASQMSPADRSREFRASFPELSSRYEFAGSVFRSELPPVIRDEAIRLFTQLCNPDASRRESRFHREAANDLQWLIRRVDILLLLLRTSSRPRSYRRKAV